jgi:hypothetical protein
LFRSYINRNFFNIVFRDYNRWSRGGFLHPIGST